MPETYLVWKFLHITGVVMLMGNITVTAIWKYFADRDGRGPVGVVLTMVGGYGLAIQGQFDLVSGWLLWAQLCFVAAGLIWMGLIVPIQIKSARMARQFGDGPVPDAYKALSKRWIFWGLISTVPLVTALWLMIARPG